MPDQPSFSPTEVLLLGPGPSPVSPAVSAASAAPLLGHLDPEFLQLMDRVQGNLRTIFATESRFTVPISGTGSAGMEAMLVNLVEPGDRMVIGVNGVFGGRMSELARRLGADVVEVKADFGKALDPAAMAAAIGSGSTRRAVFTSGRPRRASPARCSVARFTKASSTASTNPSSTS